MGGQAAGLGAGAAVPVVALQAGIGVIAPIVRRAAGARRGRALTYALLGGAAAATLGAKGW